MDKLELDHNRVFIGGIQFIAIFGKRKISWQLVVIALKRQMI